MPEELSPERAESINVVFVLADGRRQACAAASGETVLDAALDNTVPGIIGQCGGGCTCCTCHVYVAQPWFDQLPGPHQDELDLLVYAHEAAANSRLACQLVLDQPLDGLVVQVPEAQA
ncbi:MAG: 2Fe-2S iron-sulfur cluster-binding protein [bacterium]